MTRGAKETHRALLVLLDRPFKAALNYFALGIPAEHFSCEFLHSAYIAAFVDSRLTEILYIHGIDLTCTLGGVCFSYAYRIYRVYKKR